ncbi:MAG TPA: hypothetical protein VFB06_00550 [Streptosporangiaceae bacterium]|nr:hypothetical protein [Streptosporangiaceae bacterium]
MSMTLEHARDTDKPNTTMRPGHGASRGIGRSTVLALARAGYDVAVNYSSSQAAEAVGAAAEGLGAGSCCAGPTSLTRTRSSP